MLSRDIKMRLWYMPFALIGRGSFCFLLMTMALLAVTFLPSILFFAALFIWIPTLWILYARVYYHWSFAETWIRIRRHVRSILIIFAFYSVPVVLTAGLFRTVSLRDYRAWMYPGAGSSAHSIWLRFCDKLPLAFLLIIFGYFLFWPAISAIMFLDKKITPMDMMISTSEIFERLSFPKLVIITSIVLGFYWILSEYIARVFMSWESVAVMVVLTIFTVILSGWSFAFGLTLDYYLDISNKDE
ncbi:hypothetical protein HF670_08975 [Acidithiobacillus thiooxidans]|uniref:DUF4013 domain-containing protein n=1 Tax=Acidithiobacillus marinus TaxID=187490 RepID=A0A2I1DLH7_9PROT|nr:MULTISPECIES: hypothetical protein [Acidithiobacillus]MBU2839693.1 hypothetical protein [Acidithiobacillus thiooxidans]PKY10732.1 hypothetical protein B1757_09185 [Acidithiobacillus marinus]